MSKRKSDSLTEFMCKANGSVDADALLPLVYAELKRLAHAQMVGERNGHTLQTTALVHEAYLRLFGKGPGSFENRAHFFSATGEAMRRILVEWARARKREKRGAGAAHEPYDDAVALLHPRPRELLEVHAALQALSSKDQIMTGIVIQRYFVGLSIRETAQAMDLSERSVSRIWSAAKVWLGKELRDAR